jgi:hypothetical protein
MYNVPKGFEQTQRLSTEADRVVSRAACFHLKKSAEPISSVDQRGRLPASRGQVFAAWSTALPAHGTFTNRFCY